MGSHLLKAIGINPCCGSRQPAMAVLFNRKNWRLLMDNQKQNNDNLRGKDKALYTRQQKGHSIIKHILLCFVGVGLFTITYYSLSPNHYWHA